MRFVDEATIEVEAGHGGAGAVTFGASPRWPLRPDGGDGGRGADVIVCRTRITTLLDHCYKRWYRAWLEILVIEASAPEKAVKIS